MPLYEVKTNRELEEILAEITTKVFLARFILEHASRRIRNKKQFECLAEIEKILQTKKEQKCEE